MRPLSLQMSSWSSINPNKRAADMQNERPESVRRGWLSLGRKLLAFLILSLFLAMVLVGGMAYESGRDILERTVWDGIARHMDSLARIAAYPVFVEDRTDLKRILENQLRDADVVYVIARGSSGRILINLSEPGWKREGGMATFRPLPAGREKSLRTFVNDQGDRYAEGFVPLFLEPDPSFEQEDRLSASSSQGVGWVQIGFNIEWMNKQWAEFRRNLLFLCLALSVLFAGCALLLVRRIVSPIRSLVQATRKLGDGSLDCRVSIRSRDEVGELADSFNQMASRLETAQQEIREYNLELEGKVEERTRELQSAKEKLEKALEDLKELDKMKDSFLSSVSHELRTPLTSIRSFSEILLQYADTDTKTQKEFLGIINTESERLTRLINDVLDLSRIEARRMLWHDDLLSVKDAVDEVARIQQRLLEANSIQLIVDVPEDLPLVFADRDRITQVLTNLLGNAIKFSSKDDRIEIQAEFFMGRRFGENSPWVKVRVTDHGVGIDPKDHAFIFDKFSQVAEDTLTDKPKGTGLGLPICKEIVAHYQGNIWVDSQKGGGASFFFTLPGTPVRGTAELAGQAMEGSGADRLEGWRGKTILVVDDNANMRRLLQYHFHGRGYRVDEAEDGQEALDKARAGNVDLITLDLMMPAMSGYDVLGMLRQDLRTKGIPILIISVVEDQGTGILLGANDCLKKPFLEKDLMDKVRQLLTGKKRSVLIVDDDRGVRESLRLQLEDCGYSTSVAEDGEVAIETLQQSRPDLVILDVIMPKKNGPEVLQWIRRNPRTHDLPVIILTAHNLSGERVSLVTLGIDAYVEKSQGLERLLEKVDSLLNQPLN